MTATIYPFGNAYSIDGTTARLGPPRIVPMALETKPKPRSCKGSDAEIVEKAKQDGT